MSQSIDVNGVTISYPETGDVDWGSEATNFAIQVASALGKLGLGAGTTASIVGTLTVAGNTTLSANLTVSGSSSITGNETITGNLVVNGNTTLGNANTDTIAITGIFNVDSGTLYVNPTNNRIGINKTNPSVELDITGALAVSGNETVGGTLGVAGDVAVNTNKFNITASSGNTSIAGTLGVTGNTTLTGQMLSSDGTVSLPGISFSSDNNTGIFRSASDQVDIVTGGVPRSRVNSTGQQSSTIPDLSGSNTTLYNEYKCRAWAMFNGSSGSPITPNSSGNISSITKPSTGNFTVNFLNNMPDINYAPVIIYSNDSTNYSGATCLYNNGSAYSIDAPLAGSFKFAAINNSSSRYNPTYVSVAVFR